LHLGRSIGWDGFCFSARRVSRVRGEPRVAAPNAAEGQNAPSPAFRWTQGPELAEWAGMRPFSKGRGVAFETALTNAFN